ncbi:MAG TPA: adenylate/guanylate cyclase domain-containing protein [Stellaceae bacterium]|nr:adenylate/guanylate cyclase domain-containing protein [Stellaceae bacterium]
MAQHANRRLAAIVSADVAGYSRLMGADEEGTLGRLKTLRAELIDPKIAEHGGRIVKTTGDGLLLEFSSVVGAERCVVEVQTAMALRNADLPQDRRIEFRIGVNLGDIIIDGDDIFGDGVNVAARLQESAKPVGICVSSRVHDDVRDRLDLGFDDGGEQSLKNIARPVRIWQWNAGATSTAAPDPAGRALPLPEKPSIAVLPFANMSGDPEQEYFADGIAEDVITLLSKSRALFVIARNSSFTYKGRAVDVKQVGRELGVRYVLEGSVRKAGNRVRVTGQLIEAAIGGHLWAERYDRDLADIFAVQDEITASVSAAILPTMERSERERAARKPPDSLDAWECYHRGMWHFAKIEAGETALAQDFFERAIALDPGFAAAQAAMTVAILTAASQFRPQSERQVLVPRAADHARRSILRSIPARRSGTAQWRTR